MKQKVQLIIIVSPTKPSNFCYETKSETDNMIFMIKHEAKITFVSIFQVLLYDIKYTLEDIPIFALIIVRSMFVCLFRTSRPNEK